MKVTKEYNGEAVVSFIVMADDSVRATENSIDCVNRVIDEELRIARDRIKHRLEHTDGVAVSTIYVRFIGGEVEKLSHTE